jgi:hypothetical protein
MTTIGVGVGLGVWVGVVVGVKVGAVVGVGELVGVEVLVTTGGGGTDVLAAVGEEVATLTVSLPSRLSTTVACRPN